MGGRALLQDLIQGVSRRANISEQEAETFVRTVFAVVSDSLSDEKVIKIRNLGTFKLVEVDDREAVDPTTGMTTRVKGYRKVVFTPDNTLKDLINKPFSQFETVLLNESTDLADMERGVDPEASVEDEEPEEGEGEELQEETETPDVEEKESEETELPETADAEAPQTETVESPSAVEDTEETIEEDRDDMSSSSIEYQHADYQKIQEQKVEELNVTTQTVEHQTIEHQSIVHQSEPESERQSRCMRLSQGGMIGLFLFILLLMAGSYFAGYYRVLCPCALCPDGVEPAVVAEMKEADTLTVREEKRQVEPVENDSVKKAEQNTGALAASAHQQAARQDSVKSREDSLKHLRAKASEYPQVKNAKYLIVGVKTVHKLKSGESLLRLAQQVYGSREFVTYIIELNQIKDPNLVQIGKEIKLPELVKSNDNL